MEEGLEVLFARWIHMVARFANGKEFFRCRICKVVEGANSFDVTKAAFRLKSLDVGLGLAVIVFAPFESGWQRQTMQ